MEELDEIRKRRLDEMMRKESSGGEMQIEVDDGSFQEKVVEQSRKTPVIVDFWAEWCMPCLMLGPILEKITEEHRGKLVLAKMNVDESPRTSQRYRIMSIPAVKMFKHGGVADEFIGALPEPHVRQWVIKNLDGEG
jgi:thioredoxin